MKAKKAILDLELLKPVFFHGLKDSITGKWLAKADFDRRPRLYSHLSLAEADMMMVNEVFSRRQRTPVSRFSVWPYRSLNVNDGTIVLEEIEDPLFP